MIIKFDIDSEFFKKMQGLVDIGKYEDVYQFILVSLRNQMQEEMSFEETPDENKVKLQPIGNEDSEKSKYSLEIFDEKFKEIVIDYTEGITPEKHEIIWSFYNRFLPIKITIFTLGDLISANKPWIEIGELQEAALEYAQKVSEKVKNYEDEGSLGRNKKLSTGLPLSKARLHGKSKKSEQRKILAKIESGKKRFTNQFVGRYAKSEETFKGAGFVMGLIEVKLVGENCFVTLSELGKQFASLENPILNNKYEQSFSDAEVKLIYKNIYPRFPTEKKLVDVIIDKLQKNEKLETIEIDEIFEKHKDVILKFYSNKFDDLKKDEIKKFIDQARGATMGRLSELRIVNWEINKKGLSEYSLNSDKLKLLK
jgi:hypothetical protein